MNNEEIQAKFSLDPEQIGLRPRGFWVIEGDLDHIDEEIGASIGDLIVKARDGGGNPMDHDAAKRANYIGSIEDDFDRTYRYYYFRPLRSVTAADLGVDHA